MKDADLRQLAVIQDQPGPRAEVSRQLRITQWRPPSGPEPNCLVVGRTELVP